jgi:hypothetical protein
MKLIVASTINTGAKDQNRHKKARITGLLKQTNTKAN